VLLFGGGSFPAYGRFIHDSQVMQPFYESFSDGNLGDGILTTLDDPYGECRKYQKGRYGLLWRCCDIRL
ncbi:hypothetical protein PIB30_078575, partial [Stylosanthes scabra]|nr:hypothetical protein [Stylosanthes scabra]